MAHKKCPCKAKAAKHRKPHKKSNDGRVAPVKAPKSTKPHQKKTSASATIMDRGRIMYQQF